MKFRQFIVLLFAFFSLFVSYGQEKVVLSICFAPQSQWAGYYMALDKGFYAEEGLDVEIRHLPINSTKSNMEDLMSGEVQFCTNHLTYAIEYAAKGNKIVNVLQTSQKSALCCVTREPIKSVYDLDSLKIARWKTGYGHVFDFIAKKYNLKIFWIPYIYGINLFLFEAVDAMLCYSFNEYYTLLESSFNITPKNIIRISDFEDFKSFPDDGVYVTEKFYNKHPDLVEKFVRASIKGWNYTKEHLDEALQYSIKLSTDQHIRISAYHQKMMLNDVIDFQINPATGVADFRPVSRTMFQTIYNNLLQCDSLLKPVIYDNFIKEDLYNLVIK